MNVSALVGSVCYRWLCAGRRGAPAPRRTAGLGGTARAQYAVHISERTIVQHHPASVHQRRQQWRYVLCSRAHISPINSSSPCHQLLGQGASFTSLAARAHSASSVRREHRRRRDHL